jgi:hypothetical protein
MLFFSTIILGLAIGALSNSWLPRIIIPFVWGYIFCLNSSYFRRKERDKFIYRAVNQGIKPKWGMSHKQTFYLIEYLTTTSITLVSALIAGYIKDYF